MTVYRKEGESIDSLLKRFQRSVGKTGQLREAKRRQGFETAREKRIRKHIAVLSREKWIRKCWEA